MKRPGKRVWFGLAGLVLAPPVLWVLIVLALPTGWARDRIAAELRSSTRQEVRVGKVQLGLLGGLTVRGLELAAPASPSDPWLKVDSLELSMNASDLIHGRISPADCRIEGMALRVHRDDEGRLEFEGLFAPPPKPDAVAPAGGEAPPPAHEMTFRIEDATILVVDDATETRLEFTNVSGGGTHEGTITSLTELTASLNGGTLEMTARVDRSEEIALEGQVRTQDVALGVGMKALNYFIPLVAAPKNGPHAQGVLAFDLDLNARGKSTKTLANSLAGRGSLRLDGLTLDDSQVMAEVTKLLPISTRDKLGSLSGDFRIRNRRVATANTTLQISTTPVGLTGWSDFDGNLDYLVRCDHLGKAVSRLTKRLPPEARNLLADLPVDDLANLASVRVSGTLDRLSVKPADGRVATKPDPARPTTRKVDDRAKLKAAGKKLLDRVMR